MIWNSWAEFFEMGGYALYVWGSILVVFGIIVGELLELALRKKGILTAISFSNIASKHTINNQT